MEPATATKVSNESIFLFSTIYLSCGVIAHYNAHVFATLHGIYIQIYVYCADALYTHIRVSIYAHARIFIRTYAYVNTHICVFLYTQTRTVIRTYACMDTRIYAYTCESDVSLLFRMKTFLCVSLLQKRKSLKSENLPTAQS